MFDVLETLSQPLVDIRNVVFHGMFSDEEKPSKMIANVKFRRGSLENCEFQIHADGDMAVMLDFIVTKFKLHGICNNGEFDRLCDDFQENSVVTVKQGTIILGAGDVLPLVRTALSNVHWLNCIRGAESFNKIDKSSRFAVVATITNIVKTHFYDGCGTSGCHYKSLRDEQGSRYLDCPKCEQRTEEPTPSVVFEVIISSNGAKELVAIFTDNVLRLSGEPDVDSLENLARNDYQQMRERFEGKNFVVVVRPNIYLDAEWNVTAIQKIN